MLARSAWKADVMNERDESILQTATDRFERRLAEETGKLRVDMANGFGDLRAAIANGDGSLRAEMGSLRAELIERNHQLLKWALVLWVTGIAAIGALMTLLR